VKFKKLGFSVPKTLFLQKKKLQNRREFEEFTSIPPFSYSKLLSQTISACTSSIKHSIISVIFKSIIISKVTI